MVDLCKHMKDITLLTLPFRISVPQQWSQSHNDISPISFWSRCILWIGAFIYFTRTDKDRQIIKPTAQWPWWKKKETLPKLFCLLSLFGGNTSTGSNWALYLWTLHCIKVCGHCHCQCTLIAWQPRTRQYKSSRKSLKIIKYLMVKCLKMLERKTTNMGTVIVQCKSDNSNLIKHCSQQHSIEIKWDWD